LTAIASGEPAGYSIAGILDPAPPSEASGTDEVPASGSVVIGRLALAVARQPGRAFVHRFGVQSMQILAVS